MDVLNSMAYIQERGDAGRKRGMENRFAQLSQQALGARGADRNALVEQMVGVDPSAGMAFGDKLQAREQDEVKRAGNVATQMIAALKSGNPAQIAGTYQATMPYWQQHANGAPLPPQADESMLPMLYQLQAAAAGSTDGVDSASLREFNAMTQGMSAEDVAKARRVNLGLEGRASTSGYSQVKFTDSHGRERVGSFNGRTGTIDLPDGTSFNPQTGQSAPTQQVAPAAPNYAPAPEVEMEMLPGAEVSQQDEVAMLAAAQNPGVAYRPQPNGGAMPLAGKNWPQPAMPSSAAAASQVRGGDTFTSRSEEDQAGRTVAAQEQAKINAEIGNYTTMTQLEVDRASRKAEAEASAKAGVEQDVRGQVRSEGLRAELPALKSSQRSLLDAYRGLQEGRYTSGPIVGMVPDRFQSEANQQLATTINEEILAVAERMKGTLSDKDVAFLRSATFGLDKKPQANMNIIGRKLQIINDAIKRGEGGGQNPAPAGGGAVWTRDASGKLVRGN